MGENDFRETQKYAKYWQLLKNSRANKQRQTEWKKNHQGILPKKVWLDNLEIVGSYSCVEIIPYDPNTGIIYLKKRHDLTAVGGEKSWEGKLHIPGISDPVSLKGKDVLPKILRKEILKDENEIGKAIENVEFLTKVRYPEPERKTIADTLELVLPIDPSLLQEDFLPITKNNITDVIEQHKPMIEAYWAGNVPLFMDTRQQ